VPSTNANAATWYLLRYARDFIADPPDPSVPAWRRPILDAKLLYDHERHVLELEPVKPTTESEPPAGIAVSPDGEVYRVDENRSLVLMRLCDGFDREVACEKFVFAQPAGLALDRRGLLYAADSFARRVVVLSPRDGAVVGVMAGDLEEPVDVAVSPDGRAYVADRKAGRIAIFTSRFLPAGSFVPRGAEGLPTTPKPIAVAVDFDGAIVVADATHPRLLRFGPNGEALAERPLHAGSIEGGLPALGALVTLYGTKAPLSIAGVCGPCAPEDDLGKRLAAVHLALRLLLLRLASSFEDCGTYVSAALDGGRPGTPWHSIDIDADMPPGTWIKIQTVTSDDPDLIADPNALPAPLAFAPFEDVSTCDAKPVMPFNVPDRLIFSPPGRWLRLRVVLGSDGSATPTIRSIRIFYPRQSYLDLLPGAFRRDADANSFLEHFLALFEKVFTGIEDRYEEFSRQINPDAAPQEIVDWLAALVDLAFDPSWSLEKRRALVGRAMELYKLRGTPEGIARYVEIYTGIRPQIIESWLLRPADVPFLGSPGAALGCGTMLAPPPRALRVEPLLTSTTASLATTVLNQAQAAQLLTAASSATLATAGYSTASAALSPKISRAPLALRTASDALDEIYAHRFEVIFYAPVRCDEAVVIPVVDRIVTVNKPAHTVHRLRVVRPDDTRVGSGQVGLDLLLGAGECGDRGAQGLSGCATPEEAQRAKRWPAWAIVESTPLRAPGGASRPLENILGVSAVLASSAVDAGRQTVE
jgi:phage tail-like protein